MFRVWLLVCGGLWVADTASARMGELPWSDRGLNLPPAGSVPVEEIPGVDAGAKRLAAAKAVVKPAPFQFAEPFSTGISPYRDGTWDALPDGGLVWRYRVRSPGATDLNFGFTQFRLTKGATLYIRADRDGYYQGPYTAADNTPAGQFWSPVVPGDTAVIELYIPPDADDMPVLELTRINRGYRDMFKAAAAAKAAKQGSCNNDVICPEADDWRDEIRSVAVYSIEGFLSCSGTLIMDAPGSFEPYFLTADHCDVTAGNVASVVVYWNFESPTCGQLGGGSLSDNQAGAELLADREDVDMTLLKLNQRPPASYNVYYAGWDASGIAPTGSVGIHHPNTDEKAISFNTNVLTTGASCILFQNTTNTHWYVDNWEDGTTEPGSSGSGLWDPASHRLVGFLSGGDASCSTPSEYDCYGKFSVAWDSPQGASSRLKDWLDPCNSGVLAVDGSDPVDNLVPDVLAPAGGQAFEGGSLVTIAWSNVPVICTMTVEVAYTRNCAFDTTNLFMDDMEDGTNGWLTGNAGSTHFWHQVTGSSQSPSTSWFAVDATTTSDQYLISPAVLIGADSELWFYHQYNLETATNVGYDGGVVEISTSGVGGVWTDLGSFMFQNGYDDTISLSYGSPLAGREAFTGVSGGFIETRVNLSGFEGQTANFRFRLGTDSSIGNAGWWVDDVMVLDPDTIPQWHTLGYVPSAQTEFEWPAPCLDSTSVCIRVRTWNDGEPFSAWSTSPVFAVTGSPFPDTDYDCLPDDWELANGLDPYDGGLTNVDAGAWGDPDGDLVVNLDEFIGVSVPTNWLSYPSPGLSSSTNGLAVSWFGDTGRVYSLEAKESLVEGGSWITVVTNQPGSGMLEEVPVGGSTGTQRHFRLNVKLP